MKAALSKLSKLVSWALLIIILVTLFSISKKVDNLIQNYENYQNETEERIDELMETLKKKITHPNAASEKQQKYQRELKCLADNIYYESAGEPLEGQLAVATVTMNRVKSRSYPNSICGVVYQRNSQGCQFTWTCNKTLARKNVSSYKRIKALSEKVIRHGLRSDLVNGALYFRVPSSPEDELTAMIKIGNHIFL